MKGVAFEVLGFAADAMIWKPEYSDWGFRGFDLCSGASRPLLQT